MSVYEALPGAPRVLIVGPSWVGDMVMAQVLFKVVKQRYPDSRIDVLALPWSRPIVEAMPEVQSSIDMPVGHGRLGVKERWQLGRSLRGRYDWAIVLPNSLKSALIPAFARIPVRTGWRGEMRYGLLNDLRPLNKKALPLMVQRFAALAYPRAAELPGTLPAPHLVVDPMHRDQCLAEFGVTLQDSDRILGLCPGAEFGAAKKWPERHYAEVAKRWIEQGGRVWLFGSENDRESCEQIAALAVADSNQADRVVSYAGRTRLQDALSLLSCCHRVVSNDSGLMHVAAALGIPLVAVYGSTSPGFTPPMGAAAEIVRTGISCSPCFQRTCPYGHYKCLEDLPPVQVMHALERLKGQAP